MTQLSLSIPNPIQPEHLQNLLAAAGRGPVLITTHDSPDPDAFASGLALATLLKETKNITSRLVYTGLVGRAENRAILRVLTPEWQLVDSLVNPGDYSAVAIVDSQPGAGNNNLPDGLIPNIVIDHHNPLRPETRQVPFRDIRPHMGSTASMLYQYLAIAEVPLFPRLATAMFYGLRSDTNGLARNSTLADSVIYSLLLASLDTHLLHQVLFNGLSQKYFHAFNCGLQNAKINGRTITTYLGNMYRPDLVSEMADLLVRLENVDTALCLGCYENSIYLSLRTGNPRDIAGDLMQQIVAGYGKAGGHGTIAGGQIPVNNQDLDDLVDLITARFLASLGESGSYYPLLNEKCNQEE
jgi:nanoRNase/pAp phosphatase (c-di-AMP/oligoRNAs hydrolase)